jgi:hypothetical protein
VTAATTVYFTPFNGNKIAIYDGLVWRQYTFSQISVAVPSNTNTPFDIFVFNNAGTLTLEAVAWTNDTTRATALVTQDGVYVKSGTVTKRYLGTGRTTGVSGQTEDSSVNRFLWNYYNRLSRSGLNTFTSSRTTTSTTMTELNSEIRINFVVGVVDDAIEFKMSGSTANGGAGGSCSSVIALDSTTTGLTAFRSQMISINAAASDSIALTGRYRDLAVGGHFATLLGSVSGNTGTWHATDGTTVAKIYLAMVIDG